AMVQRLLLLPGPPATDAADALACAICHIHAARFATGATAAAGVAGAAIRRRGTRIRRGRAVNARAMIGRRSGKPVAEPLPTLLVHVGSVRYEVEAPTNTP